MLKQYRKRSNGDTLIEVLFAVSVFSLVAVIGLSIMNQGTAASQRALEITLVRQQMDAQAESLRFLNNSYLAAYHSGATYDPATPAGQWAAMLSKVTFVSNASTVGGSSCPTSTPTGGFVIDPMTAKLVTPGSGIVKPAPSFSQLVYTQVSGQSVLSSVEGIWIEAVRSVSSGDAAQATIGYIDFHILACWDSLGQTVPVTLGTIVRLYEPR